jgi:cell division protease FtsH
MPEDDEQKPGRQSGGPRSDGGGGGEPPRPPMRMNRGAFGWLMIVGLALILIMIFSRGMNGAQEITYTALETHLTNGNVERLEIRYDEGTAIATLRKAEPNFNTKKVKVVLPGDLAKSEAFMRKVESARPPVDVEFKHNQNIWLTVLVQMLPWILIFGLIWFFFLRQLRQTGGGAGMLGNFGRSRHRMTTKEHTNITFTDVAGIDEAKDEVVEIVEFLKNPKRFQRLGGRIPRGVLLVGDPGCGKTLLAKAIAGEADVPFFSISGSDFVEMFVGVGASRVRDLFRQAKENSPCIVFLDEIDAVGRRRGFNYTGGGHDEREQTLNAILVEMDGFETSDQVIVIAATNRADVLDPALVRPGRFDRQVYVPLPDVKGRFEILKVHAHKIKIQPPLDPKLQRLARGTQMFSGADLAAIINESALLATLASKDAVDLEDLEEARDKIRWGRAKRSRVVDDKDRELTAYHEAGHAVVQTLLKDADPVHKVSIIPRGPYGGATFSLPEKDRMTVNRSYVEAILRVLCAGRLAEAMLGKDMNSGAEADIKQATSLAKQMVTRWGMSDKLGFVYYSEEQNVLTDFGFSRESSDRTMQTIDEEVKRIVDEAWAETRRMLEENRDALQRVSQALMKYETITGEEVAAIIRGETIDRPTVADLIAAEQERRAESPPLARPVQPPPDEEPGGALPSPA